MRNQVRGELREGQIIGRRGQRLYVRYRTVMGNHLVWLKAADVERV